VFLSALAGALLLPAIAGAQPSARAGREALARAEEAYLRVDFEATQQEANAALVSGGHTKRRLTRIYQLLGIAAAALEQEDAARDAYIRMLAIDPEAQVDRSLAPRLRAPFLEARGFWSSRSDRLGAEVSASRPRSALRIDLVDPLQMAARWTVHARLDGEGEIFEQSGQVAERVYVEMPGLRDAQRIEYALEIFDQHGNRLIEIGTDDQPNVIETGASVSGGGGAGGPGTRDEGGLLSSPGFWIGAAVVATAVIVGVLLLGNGGAAVESDVTFGVN
jgi:hypothetical protein